MSKKNGAKKRNTKKRSSASKDKKVVSVSKNKDFEAALKKEARKKYTRILLVVVLVVIFALGMMLPSLAPIFASNNAAPANNESSNNESSDSSSDSSEDTSEETGVAAVDKRYASVVSSLESKLESDPNNLAALLNLGNDYMSWAYSAKLSATTDEEKAHVSDLWAKSIAYFDRYLAINDTEAAKVNRALCQFYSGDLSAATAALEALTQASPNYGPAWANLGLVYESANETDKAKSAYEKAAEVDADDEYGAKTYANARISSIESSEAAASESSSNDSSSSSGSSAADALGNSNNSLGTNDSQKGLSDALANATGTGL